MRIVVRMLLAFALLVAVPLVGFLLYAPKEKETWAILTGLLAVIAAVIAAWPALRVLEIQEDVLRPRPTPHFDLSSRHNLLQLRVKNLGGGAAYDVQLKWKVHPVDHTGNEITILDKISVLLPQESASTLVGASTHIVRELSTSRFEGEWLCRDSTGKRHHDKFVCSVDANLKQLSFDNEMPKTLHDLQEIPKELGRIADLLAEYKTIDATHPVRGDAEVR
jgi:hypothetical protein